MATDPVLAFQKGKELWAALSKDEPENQASPENLEQLIVLLTRESARRMVHLVNFTASVAKKVNQNVTHSVAILVNKFVGVAESILKVVPIKSFLLFILHSENELSSLNLTYWVKPLFQTVHLEQLQETTSSVIRSQAYSATILLKQLNGQISNILVNKHLDKLVGFNA